MTKIKFPYRAKVDGVYYAPDTEIEVREADDHVKNGAVVVAVAAATDSEKPARKKTAKSSAAK